jgi:hypothetical protein
MTIDELYELLVKIILHYPSGRELPVKFLNTNGLLEDVVSFEVVEDKNDGLYLQLG